MKTDDFPVSNGGEVDPCGVIISQLVLKTIPHALQLNSLKKTSVDDIEGDVDQCEVLSVLTPMFIHIYGNLESK